jgi:hypothetical protein
MFGTSHPVLVFPLPEPPVKSRYRKFAGPYIVTKISPVGFEQFLKLFSNLRTINPFVRWEGRRGVKSFFIRRTTSGTEIEYKNNTIKIVKKFQ